MEISSGILFAFITMLSWGTADIFAKKAIEKIGDFRSLFFNQLIGTVPVALYAFLFLNVPLLSLQMFLLVFLTGFLVIIFYFTFYSAMKRGNLSIVNPISGSYLMVTAILGAILFHETLKTHQVFAIIIIFVGMLLASTDSKKIKLKLVAGVPEALITMFGWGVAFLLVNIVSDSLGTVASFLYIRFIGLGVMFFYTSLKKVNVGLPEKNVLFYVVAAGVLDSIGMLGYNAGVIREQVSIVAPIVASFPAVTVILALLFLKEKIVGNQKIGIISILSGLVLISVV